jgi:hypothetical protein
VSFSARLANPVCSHHARFYEAPGNRPSGREASTTYEISVHSRRIGDILLRYGDGLLNLSAIERACRCGYLELGEVDLDLVPVLRGLVAARIEYYRRLILAGHRIEPILVTDGPCILDGFHRAQAHREAGRRYAPCWMVPAAGLELFKLPERRADRVMGHVA